MARAPPESISKASATIRPQEFNKVVGVDLKEVRDANGTVHRYLNVLDVATRKADFTGYHPRQALL